MRTVIRAPLALLLAAACDDACALRLDYTLELGLMHSDNIALSPVDPVDETVLIPHLDFSLSETGSNVQAAVTGMLEYRNYLDGTFGSEFRGSLDGTVNWEIVPQRFAWVFADNLGLYPISLRDPDVPGNLQQTNVFTTGPTLRFRLGPTVQAQTEARFIDSHAEDTAAFDSRRLGLAQRFQWELAQTRHLSVNFETQDVDFDEAFARDYRRHAAYAGYRQTLARVDLDASFGYSRLDFDGGGDVGGPLARAAFDWRANERNTLGIAFAWQYSDAVSALAEGAAAFDLGLGGIGIGGEAISAEVYRERRLEANHLFHGTRLNIASSVHVARYRYEEEAVVLATDRNEVGAGINAGYLLRPLLTIGATAEVLRRRYLDDDATDRTHRYGIYLSQQLSRHWRWRIDLSRHERDAGAGADSFDENAAYLRFAYTR